MLSDLSLRRATLSVTDRSLLDRAFGVVAKRQGLTIDGAAYREQMRAALPFIISAVIPRGNREALVAAAAGVHGRRPDALADVAPPARSASWTCWPRPATR